MTKHEIPGCEEALRLLALYLDRELSTGSSRLVERHLERCRSCWSRAEFESRLRERLAELGREPVRPELAGRIQALVRNFAVAGQA
jgi:anti-sigma factor RsiW